MEFRYPTAVNETNKKALNYLTEKLSNQELGIKHFNELLQELGNAVDDFPEWHPILTLAHNETDWPIGLSGISLYSGHDHTRFFTRGFITCPYSEKVAEDIISRVNEVMGLWAYRPEGHFYNDSVYPVVVVATSINLEADGTIRSRDAIAWCVQNLVRNARDAKIAETWWSMRGSLLGYPHGSRSSLFVNQHTGGHIRKILETLNNSGVYGPIVEKSLEMFPAKKRTNISKTLISTAVKLYDKNNPEFSFELHGEQCKAEIADVWGDGTELRINVVVGNNELYASGSYYSEKGTYYIVDPTGKQSIAKKFV